ncbi:hypothetical protein KEM48_001234 [Puccinia striiformis f. sp. tritici PST-130]|nr:hypothetical protein KEM48_001234 [Puccinia striiformis f. sp. tritici PST-130]
MKEQHYQSVDINNKEQEHQEHKDIENKKDLENEDNENDGDHDNEEDEDKDSTEKDEDKTYNELKREIMIDSCINILEQIVEPDSEIRIDEASETLKETNAPKKSENKIKKHSKKMKHLKKNLEMSKTNVPEKNIVVEPDDGNSEMDNNISLSSVVFDFDKETTTKLM